MKRVLKVLLIFIFLFSLCSLTAGAESTAPKGLDMYVNKELRPIVHELEENLKTGYKICGVYYYRRTFWELFNCNTFDDIISRLSSSDHLTLCVINDQYELVDRYTGGPLYMSAGSYGNVREFLSSKEKIFERIPELQGELPALCAFSFEGDGCVTYFQSENKGYVYLTQHHGDNEYLLPAEAFMKYVKWDVFGCSFVWDLSVYDINSSRFNLDAPLTGPIYFWLTVAGILTAILLVIFYFRMRKKRLTQKVSQWTEENA